MPTSPDVTTITHTPAGKFAKGNKLGRGYAGQRAVQVLKLRALRFFKINPGRLDKYLATLEEMALDPKQDGTVRVAAIKELLARALGKADQPITFKADPETAQAASEIDPREYAQRAYRLGMTWEQLPPAIRERVPRPVEAKVVDEAR